MTEHQADVSPKPAAAPVARAVPASTLNPEIASQRDAACLLQWTPYGVEVFPRSALYALQRTAGNAAVNSLVQQIVQGTRMQTAPNVPAQDAPTHAGQPNDGTLIQRAIIDGKDGDTVRNNKTGLQYSIKKSRVIRPEGATPYREYTLVPLISREGETAEPIVTSTDNDWDIVSRAPEKTIAKKKPGVIGDAFAGLAVKARQIGKIESSSASASQEAETTDTPVKNEQKSKEQQLLKDWGNCGRTADQIIQTLIRSGAKFDEKEQTIKGVEGVRPDMDPITGSVTEITFLDCIIGGVHEFTIEKHPAGACYLLQGYQGAYSPWWWQGLTKSGEDEDKEVPRPVSDLRAQYGNGQDISAKLGELAANLQEFLAFGTFGIPEVEDEDKEEQKKREQALEAKAAGIEKTWKKLPFQPGDTAPVARATQKTVSPIDLKVTVRVLTNPDEVARALQVVLEADKVTGSLGHHAIMVAKRALDSTRK